MLLYRQRISRWRDRILIALFVFAIILPLLGYFLGWSISPRTERRELASFPPLSSKGRVWKAFPGAFDAYFNDHFGFRAVLIGWSNFLKFRCNVSTSPYVMIGLDDWLYYRPAPLAQIPGPFTPEELEHWQHVLEHRQAWLARRGCRYVLFIPPNKETIYPEHLPESARPYAHLPRLEQLVAHLRQHSTVPILDVRDALREARQHELIYFKNDAHWNDRGAFVAYQQLGRLLSQWFPLIQPLPRSAFRDTNAMRQGGDLADNIAQDHRLEEWGNLESIQKRKAHMVYNVMPPAGADFPMGKPFACETDDDRLPRAVMFHDSFNCSLHPFLSEHFRRIAYYWHDDFHQDAVEAEHPDVVIQELLERKLNFLKPNDIEE